jgi:hypothetical protein
MSWISVALGPRSERVTVTFPVVLILCISVEPVEQENLPAELLLMRTQTAFSSGMIAVQLSSGVPDPLARRISRTLALSFVERLSARENLPLWGEKKSEASSGLLLTEDESEYPGPAIPSIEP